jgi:rsbT co-antagonist protein RsbR
LFAADTKNVIELNVKHQIDFNEIFDRMAKQLVEDRQHELTLLAQELGKTGAKNDLPLVIMLELLQAFRKTYWNFLHHYYKHVELEDGGLLSTGHQNDYILDQFIWLKTEISA